MVWIFVMAPALSPMSPRRAWGAGANWPSRDVSSRRANSATHSSASATGANPRACCYGATARRSHSIMECCWLPRPDGAGAWSDVGDARRSSVAGFSTGPGADFCASLDESINRALEQDHSFDTVVLTFAAKNFPNAAFVRSGADSERGALRAPAGRDHRGTAAPRQESRAGDGQPGSARSARLYGSRCAGMERGSRDPRGRPHGGAESRTAIGLWRTTSSKHAATGR